MNILPYIKEITNYKGYVIDFDSKDSDFLVEIAIPLVNSTTLCMRAKTMDEAKAIIDNHIERNKDFEPILIFDGHNAFTVIGVRADGYFIIMDTNIQGGRIVDKKKNAAFYVISQDQYDAYRRLFDYKMNEIQVTKFDSESALSAELAVKDYVTKLFSTSPKLLDLYNFC